MISNCGIDERGLIAGGMAGDQTGGEYKVRTWYYGNWTHVFRHPDPVVRRLIARKAIQAANNDLIGYDQGQRLTFWQHLKASDYDPSKITIACEADCSSSTAAIVKAVGVVLGNKQLANVWEGMSTYDEVNILRGAGFEVLTASQYRTSEAHLLPGDILLKSGHTCIEVGSGRVSDFPDEEDVVRPEDIQNIVNSTVNEIVSKLPERVWQYVYGDDNLNPYSRLVDVLSAVTGNADKLDELIKRLTPTTPIVPFGGPVYRLINTSTGAHTWTNATDRRDELTAQGWMCEGEAFALGVCGDPVWCLVHPGNGEAMLTVDMTEAKALAAAGWLSEGVIGTTGDGAEVHRLYNRGNGYHVFTTDANEISADKSAGWTDEGVAFQAAD